MFHQFCMSIFLKLCIVHFHYILIGSDIWEWIFLWSEVQCKCSRYFKYKLKLQVKACSLPWEVYIFFGDAQFGEVSVCGVKPKLKNCGWTYYHALGINQTQDFTQSFIIQILFEMACCAVLKFTDWWRDEHNSVMTCPYPHLPFENAEFYILLS